MEQVRLTIPESTDDITVGQFQRYLTLLERNDLSQVEHDKRKIEIFTKLPYRDVGRLSAKDYAETIELIDAALNVEGAFKQRFKIGEVEFGFVPNLDMISAEQWASLMEIDTAEGPNPFRYHEFLAVLFHPIEKTDAFGNYSVMPYTDGAFDETMKSAPMSIVNGVMLFFWNLGTELLNSTLKSTQEEQQKGIQPLNFSEDGAGMPHSRRWLKTNRGK